MQIVINSTSRFAKLIDMHAQIVGSLLYLRFEFLTGDAAGHNMVTLASDRMLAWILSAHPVLRYVSISGNFCFIVHKIRNHKMFLELFYFELKNILEKENRNKF